VQVRDDPHRIRRIREPCPRRLRPLGRCPSNLSDAHTAKARAAAQNCASHVDLGAVPLISANIVASEPSPVVERPTYADPKLLP